MRDIAIQKRENDLVLATFGRGFYILDDYTPLRTMTEQTLASNGVVFPVAPAPLYVESYPLGLAGTAFQGASYFAAPNPPYGAVFTYYLKDALKSHRTQRQEAEKAAAKKGEDVFYPSWDSLKVEDRQEDPAVVVTVSDAATAARCGASPRPATSGINRVAWDLRLQPPDPVNGPPYQPDPDYPFTSPPIGPFVVPGTYQVSFAKRVDGVFTPLGEPTRVSVVGVDSPGARAPGGRRDATEQMDRRAGAGGARHVGADQRDAVAGGDAEAGDRRDADRRHLARASGREIEHELQDTRELLNGDPTRARRNEASPPTLLGRLQGAIGSAWSSTLEAPTAAQQADLDLVRAKFDGVLQQVRQIIDVDLKALEAAAEQAGVPWTPGRVPKPPMARRSAPFFSVRE